MAAFVEASRYPINRLGVGTGLDAGLRGIASEHSVVHVWGVDAGTCIEKADPWPWNPDGELFRASRSNRRRRCPRRGDHAGAGGGFAEVGFGVVVALVAAHVQYRSCTA